MRTIQNTSPAGRGAPTLSLDGITFELDRSTTDARYVARVPFSAVQAFVAARGVHLGADLDVGVSFGHSLINRDVADVKFFRAPDAWVATIGEKRARVLRDEFGIEFAEGNADLPALAG